MTLFDTSAGAGGEARRVSLVRLAGEISRGLSPIGRIAVDGEVHSAKAYNARRYFTLRDRNARISVTVAARNVRHCKIQDGEAVRVVGTLNWDTTRGELRLDAQSVDPRGEGAVAAVIAEARERLEKEGVLNRARRPLPLLPRVVGVICGQEAAVRKDIESVISARFAGYPVVFRQSLVSGGAAPAALIDAVLDLDERDEVEVIVIARGGGDATELLPFSDEELCRTVASCATPTVSAIGHDGDRPLLDDVADHRCGTPSIAAALVIPSEADLRNELDSWLLRVTETAFAQLARAEARLDGEAPARALRAGLDGAALRLERAANRLDAAHPRSRVKAADAQLLGFTATLEALDPVRVLERGYAVVRDAAGTVVRDASQIASGDAVRVSLAHGSFAADVTEAINE
ncbi:MAG TPA: exodeoxyribonuclease VII large subunit [Acidimicrobiales bacterium]|nr:exodeoxyribonuclease VII large subunit [Acidimicrobiales bacterium]